MFFATSLPGAGWTVGNLKMAETQKIQDMLANVLDEFKGKKK